MHVFLVHIFNLQVTRTPQIFFLIFAIVFTENSCQKCFPLPPTFQSTGCSLNRVGTDVMSHQGLVIRSMARRAGQMPLGRQEWCKVVSLVADTELHDLV